MYHFHRGHAWKHSWEWWDVNAKLIQCEYLLEFLAQVGMEKRSVQPGFSLCNALHIWCHHSNGSENGTFLWPIFGMGGGLFIVPEGLLAQDGWVSKMYLQSWLPSYFVDITLLSSIEEHADTNKLLMEGFYYILLSNIHSKQNIQKWL